MVVQMDFFKINKDLVEIMWQLNIIYGLHNDNYFVCSDIFTNL